MVSIPDWSKLGRLFDAPRDSTPNPNRYLKQREADAVKQAEEHGYFLNVSRSYIEDNLLQQEEDPLKKKSVLDKYDVQVKDLGQIKMMKLVGAHLRTVGDIGLCKNVTICILNGNFITRFDGLISCTKLVKLDLHNNQISALPGHGFWMCMRSLQLLHLHDNPIGRLENLHNLSSCPQLVGLTLHDTPLCLKRNYRHHVVNSIWSLKALDNYVISDEEIIEDADFGSHYSSLHPNFAVDLCPPVKEDSDYIEERTTMFEVMADINFILSHNSPVLIIQKYVRGMLARRTLDLLHRAAKTIQRKYRNWKGASPPPVADARFKPSDHTKTNIDYDTYLQNRRPGSQPISESSLPPILKQHTTPREHDQFDRLSLTSEHSVERRPASPQVSGVKEGGEGGARKHIFINLAKLQMGTLQSLQDDAMTMETMLPTEVSYMTGRESKSRREARRPRPRGQDKKRKVIKSVKQFFGPMVETVPSPEPDTGRSGEGDEQDEIPLINFRLKGLKENVSYYDPTSEMVFSKKDVGREIRAGEDEYHRGRQLEPRPVIDKKQSGSSDKRMFNRIQGTMGLSCLWAVHQAYRDREKAEKQAVKMEHTMGVKEQREAAKERIKLFQEEKKAKALKERERDSKQAMEILEKRELARLNYIDKNSDQRQKSSQFLRRRKTELTFMTDFNTQNTSVSNALLRHDRQARSEDKLQARTDRVGRLREDEKEQTSVVSKYLEHRSLMRQTETAMQRAALDTKMLQEANDRVMEAKTRVEQLKNRSATVEQFYPLPSVSTHSLPPVGGSGGRGVQGGARIIVDDLRGLDRFHTEVYMKHGRIGRHHTSVV